jgi:uncharacterized membrane protein YjjP (DUF1212 family)
VQPEATDSDEGIALVLELARALQRCGVPVRHVEDVLTQAGERLGMQVEVSATVTAVMLRIGAASALRSTILRAQPAAVDLGALSTLDSITHDFLHQRTDVQQTLQALASLEQNRPQLSLGAEVACASAGGAAWSILLGGAWPELVCTGLLSALIAWLRWSVRRRHRFEREFIALAGLLTGLGASAGVLLFADFQRQAAVIATLVPLLPGYAVVIAAEELASQELVSGSARMSGALIIFAQLVFGVALGGVWVTAIAPGTREVGFVIQLCAVMPALVALSLQLHGGRRGLGWGFTCGLVAFVVNRLAAHAVGLELGAFVSALSVGLVGNASARWLGRSALQSTVPGVLVLVPGSLGFRSASALWTAEPLEGLRTGVATALIAVAIAIGLIVANSLVPPRRLL